MSMHSNKWIDQKNRNSFITKNIYYLSNFDLITNSIFLIALGTYDKKNENDQNRNLIRTMHDIYIRGFIRTHKNLFKLTF